MQSTGERARTRGNRRPGNAGARHAPGRSRQEPPRLRPLALACLLAFGGAGAPASAANCNAGDFTALSACISGAGAGDTITLTADITASGALPDVNSNVTLVNNGHNLTSVGLSKTGTGTLTLDTANNISNIVSLAGGAVAVSDGAALGNSYLQFSGGALRGTQTTTVNSYGVGLTGGGTISAAAGTTLSVGGNTFAGMGAEVHFGSATDTGTVVLTGSSSGSAAGTSTYIDGGTLRSIGWGANGLLNTTSLNIAAAGTLLVDNFNTDVSGLNGTGSVVLDNAWIRVSGGNFGGVISGSGGLRKWNAGTLTLTGENTYAGTTSISVGTVRVGNGGTTGTLGTGNVANDSALVFDRADTYVVANNISGSGTVTQAGSGTTVFTGSNTYSGTTTISSGTLQIGNGGTTGTLGSGGGVTNSAALVFNRADTYVVANNISGTGTVTQAGTGTTVFTGSNTYSGTTTISAGTLRIGDGGTSGTLGTGAVSNSGTLAFNRSDTITVANNISGGTVTQMGSGTTILTGNNGYSNLNLNAGTVQAASSTNLGAANIYLAGGALRASASFSSNALVDLASGRTSTITAAAGSTLTFANSFNASTGNATLVLGSGTDTGTIVIGGNAYSGSGSTVRVAGGTVVDGAGNFGNQFTRNALITQVDAGATLDFGGYGTAKVGLLRGAGTIKTDGLLTVDGDTFAGSITGSGGLTKTSNLLTLALTGSNTYSGTTTVSAGTLRVGDNGAAGTLGTGSVVNNATLTFYRNNTYQVDNLISGSGTLNQNGDGRTVLTAANTFNGTTNVNAGVLAIDGSLRGNANVNSGARMEVGGSFTGNAQVNGGGVLKVNGLLSGTTSVGSGGTLGGNGTLGNVNVMSGGVLAPGNSIGTLTVNGNLVFNGGSIYRVETDAAGNADRVNVNGNLTINGGTVDVQAGSGNYARNTRYTILTNTGTQTGTFSSVTSNLAFLTPTLFYDANNVYLNLLSANAPSYTSVAQTPNQRSVAAYLNGFANSPGNAQAEALIRQIDNLSADQARNAFDALSGSQHASASQVALAGTRAFDEALGRRLGSVGAGSGFGGVAALRASAFGLQSPATPWSSADAPVQLAGLFGGTPAVGGASTLNGAMMGAADGSAARETGRAASGGAGNTASGHASGLWGQALGTGGRTASDGNGAGSAYRAGGFMAGYERALSEAWTAGAAAAYTRSSWEASINGIAPASGKVATPQGTLYARHARGSWLFSVSGSYAEHRFDTSRTVTVGTTSSSATSSHLGREWGLSTQAEYALAAGIWEVRPLAGLRHARLREEAFSESGNAGSALAVDSRMSRSTTWSAGVRLLRPFGDGGSVGNSSNGGNSGNGGTGGGAQGGWELRAIYSHLSGDNDAPLSARLAGQAASFTVSGTPLRRDAFQLGAGVSAQIGRGLAGFADVSYQARGSGQDAYAISAGLRYVW